MLFGFQCLTRNERQVWMLHPPANCFHNVDAILQLPVRFPALVNLHWVWGMGSLVCQAPARVVLCRCRDTKGDPVASAGVYRCLLPGGS